jgi:hypothetical protein
MSNQTQTLLPDNRSLDQRLHDALINHAYARAQLAEAKLTLVQTTVRVTTDAERSAALAALAVERTRASVETAIRRVAAEIGEKVTEQLVKTRIMTDTRVQQAEFAALEADIAARYAKSAGNDEVAALQQEVLTRQRDLDITAAKVEALRAELTLAAVPM